MKENTEITATEKEQNRREFERLKSIYPLFKFHLEGKVLTINFSDTHSFSPWLEHGHLQGNCEDTLDREHMKLSVEVALMKKYPDLNIGAFPNKDGFYISLWIKRENGTGEGISDSINLVSSRLHPTLKHFQKEAEKAKQKDWFFCTGCNKAEPIANYDYYYFTGRYCKKYAAKHPEYKRQAMNETYE